MPFEINVSLMRPSGCVCCSLLLKMTLGFCYPLTPDNSMVGLPTLQGGFVSPMRTALYARVSTHDQQTLAMQIDAMHEFATRRGWTIIATMQEIASGAKDR